MKQLIKISTKKNLIEINIDEDLEQKEIIENLKKKLTELSKLYKDDKTPILVVGKVLKNDEMDEIEKLIKSKIDVKVDFDSPRILGLHGIKRVFHKDIATSQTKFHKGSLRSGQKIVYEGSIVVLGDVNGGAEIIAGENVVVLGILRGVAHAGAKGNKDAIISAAAIECPQIRIANIVKQLEKDSENRKNYAYVNEEDKIVIE